MEKIIKKSQEVSQIWSDFSGKPFDHDIAPIEVKISFSYGSKYDDNELILHYTDQEFQPLLNQIKLQLSEKTKKEIKKILQNKTTRKNKEILSDLINKKNQVQ